MTNTNNAKRRTRGITERVLSLLLCVMFFVSLIGCGSADISSYADRQIRIVGLLEEDFYITPGELAEMECISATARGETEKAGTVQAYGPTLATFLEAYGKTVDEFYSIKFCAEDDYDVTLGAQTFANYDVILSIANGSEPLYERQQPLRVVIPGADSGKWVRLVTEIIFTYKK